MNKIKSTNVIDKISTSSERGKLTVNLGNTPPVLYVGDGTNINQVGPVIYTDTKPIDARDGSIWINSVSEEIQFCINSNWKSIETTTLKQRLITGTDYTITENDRYRVLVTTENNPVSITIPIEGGSPGLPIFDTENLFQFDVIQLGDGKVTVFGDTSVDITSKNAIRGFSKLYASAINQQYGSIKITQSASNTWNVSQDIGNVKPFQITVRTTAPTEDFTLPFVKSGVYNCTISWGDGNYDDITTWDQGETTHNYAVAGDYQILIIGQMSRFAFNDGVNDVNFQGQSVLKCISIDAWGDIGFISLAHAFEGCTNLVSVVDNSESLGDISNVTDFKYAWENCSGLTSFPLLDISNGTNFNSAWHGCSGLTSFPLLNTSKGTNFTSTWYGCSGLTSFPLLDTSKGTIFTNTWSWCTGLTSFPLLDTSKGTNFTSTWSLCDKLISFPLLDTSKGTDFSYAWNNCYTLTSFPLLDTSKGTDFSDTWANCYALTSFPLIDTSNGTIFSNTWSWCTGLTSFPLIVTSKGTNFSDTWNGCTGLTSFPNIDTSSGTNFSDTWNDCTGLTSFPNIDTSSGTNFSDTWNNCYTLTSFPNIDTSSGTNFSDTWNNCYTLTSFPNIDTSSGTNFSSTWNDCTGLTLFPNIDTSSGTNFSETWNGCTGLTSFPNIDTSSGTNFSDTWNGCTHLDFDASGFDISKATTMENIFKGTAFSDTNYDLLLTSWSAKTVQPNVLFHAGIAKFTKQAQRDILTNVPNNWNIIDGGAIPTIPVTLPFIITVKTSSANESFKIPCGNIGAYDAYIDWGDSSNDFITTFTDRKLTHNYATAGSHKIEIRGKFPGIYFNNSSDKDKLISIDAWGDTGFISLAHAFEGCTNLVSVAPGNILTTGDTNNVRDFDRTWNGCTGLTSFSLIDTSNVRDFDRTWNGCTGLTSFPLIDTSNGTNFSSTWNGCTGLTLFPLIVTSSGTNFSSTWNGCTGLTLFPLIDTSSGTNFSSTWNDCTGLTSFPNIDTSSGTNFSDTWNDCTGLTLFPNIDTSSGTNFSDTWNGCTGLTLFPNIDTSSGTNFSETWNGCTGLTSFPNIDTSSGTNFSDTWNGCTHLDFDASGFDISKATTMENIFKGTAFSDTNYDLLLTSWSAKTVQPNVLFHAGIAKFTKQAQRDILTNAPNNWNITDGGAIPATLPFIITVKTSSANESFKIPRGNVGAYDAYIDWGDSSNDFITTFTDRKLTHNYATAGLHKIEIRGKFPGIYFNDRGDKDKLISIDAWGDTGFISLAHAFEGCTNLVSVAPGNILTTGDTNNVRDFNCTWSGCTGLTSFSLIDTSSGTNFSSTWYSCSGLTSFPLIDTSNGRNFSDTWYDCSGLTSFPLINTSNGPDFSNTWANCSRLTAFPLIDTSNGTGFLNTWNDCSGLTAFPLIDTSSGTNFESTWHGCSGLTSFPLIDTSNGTSLKYAWKSCTGLTSFPNINTSSVIDLTDVWNGCTHLDFDASGFNISNVTSIEDIFENTSFGDTNYDLLLISWSNQTVHHDLVFNAGNARCTKEANRNVLTDYPNNWMIYDGGRI